MPDARTRCASLRRRAHSLTDCRKVLYHESLRHVPTAATHGRGGHTPGKENAGGILERSGSFLTSLSIDPLVERSGYPRAPPPPPRLRSSNEKEMLTRLSQVFKMPKGPPPSTRQVAQAWSSSLRSS